MSAGNASNAAGVSKASLLRANAGGASRMLSPVLTRAMEQHCEETAAADLGKMKSQTIQTLLLL